MPVISSRRTNKFLRLAKTGDTPTQRGRMFESLICYLFGKIPGVIITHRDQLNIFLSEEIDIALWNDKVAGALDFLPNIILIEAKNWLSPVGSVEVAWFDRKLTDRGLDFGILVALNGITGNAEDRTAAHHIIAGCLRQKRRLVILTESDIINIRDTDELVLLIKRKLCELAVTGSLSR